MFTEQYQSGEVWSIVVIFSTCYFWHTCAKNDNDSAIFGNDEADFSPQRGNHDFGNINTNFGKEVLPPGARKRNQL